MAAMSKCHISSLFFVLFLILASLALIVVSIVTDYWYRADASRITNDPDVRREFSYNYGMWRKCYDFGIPDLPDVSSVDKQGDCLFTYKNLVRRAEDNLSEEDYRYLTLERCWVGFMIAAAGVQLFTILGLICGLWPGECQVVKRPTLYLVAALGSLLAAMCGIVSGTCFIALRDLNNTSRNIYPENVDQSYQFSFMLGWIGTGLCLIEGFVFLCLLRVDYKDVNEMRRYTYQTM